MTAATGDAESEFMNEEIDPERLESLRIGYLEVKEVELALRAKPPKETLSLQDQLSGALDTFRVFPEEVAQANNEEAWSPEEAAEAYIKRGLGDRALTERHRPPAFHHEIS
jgi:hypothetical protein